ANVVVHPGDSIQAAVDAATPGDTITVDAGTYNQSVTIQKDGIKLRGAGSGPGGTVLNPGDVGGICDFAGICVVSQSDDPFVPTKNVEISGFAVDGFPAFGIVAFGTENLRIHDNEATDNDEYGIARFASK